MKKYLVLILLVFPLSACSPQLKVKPVVPPANGEPASHVVVIRNYNFYGAGLHDWITYDGTEIAGLRTNQYTEFSVPTGVHAIGVKWFGGWKFLFWNHKEIKSKFEKDKTYYFLTSPTALGSTEIETIDKTEANKRIEKSTKVTPGTIGN